MWSDALPKYERNHSGYSSNLSMPSGPTKSRHGTQRNRPGARQRQNFGIAYVSRKTDIDLSPQITWIVRSTEPHDFC